MNMVCHKTPPPPNNFPQNLHYDMLTNAWVTMQPKVGRGKVDLSSWIAIHQFNMTDITVWLKSAVIEWDMTANYT